MSDYPPQKRYFLVDEKKGKVMWLQVGKTIIGRGPSHGLGGAALFCIESPLLAVSRVQAIIELVSNGDAWLQDCGSTNGTFLSVNAGLGIRLKPQRVYQLTPGNHIVFGDVRTLFVDESFPLCREYVRKLEVTGGTASLQSTECGLSSGANDDAPTDTHVDLQGSLFSSDKDVVSLSCRVPEIKLEEKCIVLSQKSHGSCASNMSYDAQHSPSLTQGSVAAMRKRNRNSSEAASQRTATPKLRNEAKIAAKPVTDVNEDRLSAAAQRIRRLCFSGMDDEMKCRSVKAAHRLGYTTVEDIKDADALIVGQPVSRTPKLIIAVGCGIPVLVDTFLKKKKVVKLKPYIPSFEHGIHFYSSEMLCDVIFRSDNKPLLVGRMFCLKDIPMCARDVPRYIIEGCGGTVSRSRGSNTVNLTEAALDKLYDGVLRGDISKSSE
ncbi:FHA domain [Trypanosoma vivax]|uniref:FHA domain-containing protein n=1 Tax=Trypanosoma vivax (strain Y486) TaxID=1055687 RepID=G0TTS6_TRYVY|nr:hypothetical protein TRVL_00073 [Trypanosoma vivax]KAH8613575.1 FHA domain [Trypanosoma vivax]CCC47357.1 conserved hypothetical protein [Trypanosoma vivax Y486]